MARRKNKEDYKKMSYKPPQRILDNYAKVFIRFALRDGKGIKKGDVVSLNVPENAKPMLLSLRREVLKAGGHPIVKYRPDEITKEFFDYANKKQLTFFPEKMLKGYVDEIDHLVSIIADTNKKELEKVDPKKIMLASDSKKQLSDWLTEKENKGKFTWTLGLYATEAMAKEAGVSLKQYWNQIIKACHLDAEDPIKEWKKADKEIKRLTKKLDSLKIEKVRVESQGTDLTVGLGPGRKWMGGRGRNIPSFEVFISPNKHLTEGKIEFDQPLYRYGNLIKGIKLEFKKGKVVKASAKKGEKTLKEMIKVKGADMAGEFSLTDKNLSRIDRFMGETLFDENFGGDYGNTHIALGKSYKDSYPGDPNKVSKKEWEKLGYNDSSVHTDIVSTKNRKVTAWTKKGKMVIYEDGEFKI